MQGATTQLKSDKAFVMQCAVMDPEAFKYAADEIKFDKSFVLDAVSHKGTILQYVPPSLQADIEIAKAAIASEPAAVAYAHTSTRSYLDARLPWDTADQHFKEKKAQEAIGVGNKAQYPIIPAIAGMPLTQEQSTAAGHARFWKPKCNKIVQFSALSTMTANMGQANYVAGNSYLDKMPFYERPEVDAVTLMWGAVGNIGMRWKAFASADMLNANPEALMQVDDAARVLHVTATQMEPPEWYAASFFDEWTRQSMLAPTAGMIQGEDYAPIFPPVEKRKEVPEPDVQKEVERIPEPEAGPLGGWPGLNSFSEPIVEQQILQQAELAEGDRVRLHGLQSKNGMTGVLIRCIKGGKWKVKMDLDGDNALLKAAYLERLEPGAPIGAAVEEEAASRRKQESEARRARLKAAAGQTGLTSATVHE